MLRVVKVMPCGQFAGCGREIFDGFSRFVIRLANGSSVARVARPWSDLLAHY